MGKQRQSISVMRNDQQILYEVLVYVGWINIDTEMQ